jgi:hypothetical protein
MIVILVESETNPIKVGDFETGVAVIPSAKTYASLSFLSNVQGLKMRRRHTLSSVRKL